jgi:hypothetical protein
VTAQEKSVAACLPDALDALGKAMAGVCVNLDDLTLARATFAAIRREAKVNPMSALQKFGLMAARYTPKAQVDITYVVEGDTFAISWIKYTPERKD